MESPAALYEAVFGREPERVTPLREDGSNRRLFRLEGTERSVVGVYHQDRDENDAFIGFSRHFFNRGLPVPEILAVSRSRRCYLETDLGDETLANRIKESRVDGAFPDGVREIYEEVVRTLPRFQVTGYDGIDFSLCYQGAEFDTDAMMRDLHYFRDCFLRLIPGVPVNDDALERDFRSLAGFLQEERTRFFLYRDFQSRNIMIVRERPFFIDYQSGRAGALQYDMASLLYDARADLGEACRAQLLDVYLEEVARITRLDRERFLHYFPGFVLIRILQALGAYGNLGVRQGKKWFLDSVPFALRNLAGLMKNPGLFERLPELRGVLVRLTDDPDGLRLQLP